jgi:formylmethanofuran dehydrogenase subunit E
MNETLEKIERFHGHLGPYAVIGYRMGKIASEKLGNNPFSKKAEVWTGTKPPLSCIIDGIQISSGCTLGKGNIIIHENGIPKARFTTNDGKNIEIALKTEIKNYIDNNVTEENIKSYSEEIYKKSDQELFEQT